MLPILTNRYVLGAIAVVAVLAAVWGYGHHQFNAGAEHTRAAIEKQQIAIALGQQVEKDRADAEHRGRILASQATANKWASELDATGRMLRDLRKQLQTAGTCGRLDDSGEDWIGILGRSWAEYQSMADEAGRLADKVTGLQGYIRALQPK